MTEELLTVGQVAARFGITVRTLHHYDAIGLVTPSERSWADYRLYAPGDVRRLARVVLLRRLEMPLADIAEVLDDVRRTEAARYLTTTNAPMGQVAGLLGLSEQSALSRACRRWFGASPREVRRLGPGGTMAP